MDTIFSGLGLKGLRVQDLRFRASGLGSMRCSFQPLSLVRFGV